MVTPGGSRPAELTQEQVDDLVRGGHDDAARILRPARIGAPPAEKKAATESGSRPVDLSARDMDFIARSGTASKPIAGRIAGAERPKEPAKGGAKAAKGASAGKDSSYPTQAPQLSSNARRRTS